MMKGQQELGVKGGYSLRVFKEDGAEVKEKYIPFVQNVVTNFGIVHEVFDRLLDGRVKVIVGTGTNSITQTSTGLGSRLLGTDSTNESATSLTHADNGNGTVTSTGVFNRSFAIGDFNGESISEVGLEEGFSSDFVAGQLIKDSGGSPTTITILSDEQLIVEYVIEVTSWFTRQELATLNVTVNGVTTTARLKINPYLRDSNLANNSVDTIISDPDIRDVTFFDSTAAGIFDVGNTGSGSMTVSSGVATMAFSHTFSPSLFNSTDIKYVAIGQGWTGADVTDPFQGRHAFVLVFDTPIEKTSSQAMTIDFSVDITATQA